MPFYDFRCECGRIVEIEAHMGDAPAEVLCECNKWAKRVFYMPCVSFNRWNVDYKFNDVSEEMDGERDATAAGFNE